MLWSQCETCANYDKRAKRCTTTVLCKKHEKQNSIRYYADPELPSQYKAILITKPFMVCGSASTCIHAGACPECYTEYEVDEPCGLYEIGGVPDE